MKFGKSLLFTCLITFLFFGCRAQNADKKVQHGMSYRGAELKKDLFDSERYQYDLNVNEPSNITCAIYVVKNGKLEKARETKTEITAPSKGFLVFSSRKEDKKYSYDYKLSLSTETVGGIVEVNSGPVSLDMPKGYEEFTRAYDSRKEYDNLLSGYGAGLFSQFFKKSGSKSQITALGSFRGDFEENMASKDFNGLEGIYLVMRFDK